MFKESGQSSSRQNAKRKRRSSENSPILNDENLPIKEDKKLKVETKVCEQPEASTSAIDVECERLPLSELSLFDKQSSSKQSQHSDEDENSDVLDDLICCEEDRLSIADSESDPPSNESCIVLDSSPIAQELSEDGGPKYEREEEEEDLEDCLYVEDETFYEECVTEQPDADTAGPSISGLQSARLRTDSSNYGQLSPVSNPTPSSSKRVRSISKRTVDIPELQWAKTDELWEAMIRKDETSINNRNEDMFINHPSITPRMRSVLFDWIMEVCEVYKLHRESYYLSMDYVDRYLSLKSGISKSQLQLIGVTCLFIAAKMEEIYPPKIVEFAYVTDGACNDEDILQQEIVILKTLNFELSPMTINNWLSTYVQLCYKDEARINNDFVYSQLSGQLFVRLVQLLDLATLDLNCLKFSYSMLAATCVYLACSKRLALKVSG
ncbi:G1/S-specific cyclin-E1 [Nilaparvata lugens]|uniref:G1/S-specific cyclin-E1 n=1 Tax=Nilaparvata lugens TaxID=108931 RepID=UPI00193CD5CC|nr:G1/S-specific cyclin-E1 [Nilaparvata lugens]XP_039276324.1 G1/S-specific cyclin-E1 [Nilaparvata lugens]XP_039276325.1 G1/S-specific cyclin-E1 [Nilaparvata lugens]